MLILLCRYARRKMALFVEQQKQKNMVEQAAMRETLKAGGHALWSGLEAIPGAALTLVLLVVLLLVLVLLVLLVLVLVLVLLVLLVLVLLVLLLLLTAASCAADPILGLVAAFHQDDFARKVNLAQGVNPFSYYVNTRGAVDPAVNRYR